MGRKMEGLHANPWKLVSALQAFSGRETTLTGGSRTPARDVSAHSGLSSPGKIVHGVGTRGCLMRSSRVACACCGRRKRYTNRQSREKLPTSTGRLISTDSDGYTECTFRIEVSQQQHPRRYLFQMRTSGPLSLFAKSSAGDRTASE